MVADRLAHSSGLRELATEVVQAARQVPQKRDDAGIVIDELLSDRQCLQLLGLCFRYVAVFREQDAEVLVSLCQQAGGIP